MKKFFERPDFSLIYFSLIDVFVFLSKVRLLHQNVWMIFGRFVLPAMFTLLWESRNMTRNRKIFQMKTSFFCLFVLFLPSIHTEKKVGIKKIKHYISRNNVVKSPAAAFTSAFTLPIAETAANTNAAHQDFSFWFQVILAKVCAP